MSTPDIAPTASGIVLEVTDQSGQAIELFLPEGLLLDALVLIHERRRRGLEGQGDQLAAARARIRDLEADVAVLSGAAPDPLSLLFDKD